MQSTRSATRPRTVLEKQPYLLQYGAGISIFSPYLTSLQLCKVYHKRVPVRLISLYPPSAAPPRLSRELPPRRRARSSGSAR
jgi:hypothetical protein